MGRRVGSVSVAGRVVEGPLTLERDFEGVTVVVVVVVVVVVEETRRLCENWGCIEAEEEEEQRRSCRSIRH